MKFQPPRGMRDIGPIDFARLDYVCNKIKGVLSNYGFQFVSPAALENFETLAAKAGPEIEKEIYAFNDKSNRKIALRFDLTVGMARMVANSNYPRPAKLACISNMWRYDRPQYARYREFWQWDAESFGSPREETDAEIIALTCDIMDSLGLDYEIRVSNRKLIEGILLDIGVKQKDLLHVMRIIDKASKVSEKKLTAELKKYTKDADKIIRLENMKNVQKISKEINTKNKLAEEGKKEIEQLFSALKNFGKADKCVIDLSIVRGIDYYTGLVYEAWVKGEDRLGAVAGGGRFDNLMGLYGNPMPATGIAGGIERMLLSLKDIPIIQNPKVLVVYVNDEVFGKAIDITQALRSRGISASIDLNKRSLGKQLDYANKLSVKFAVIVGPEELKESKVKLRNMKTGEEKEVEIDKLADVLS